LRKLLHVIVDGVRILRTSACDVHTR